MSKVKAKKPSKKVSFEFLKDFSFRCGVGNYAAREVCIMSAANLAVLVAEGKANLGDITRYSQIQDRLKELSRIRWYSSHGTWSRKNQEEYDQLMIEADALALPSATDHLSCVSDHLRVLLINRNDSTTDKAELKAWALKYLPKIIGTKRNKKVEASAAAAGRAARAKVENKFLEEHHGDQSKEAQERLKNAISVMKKEINSKNPDGKYLLYYAEELADAQEELHDLSPEHNDSCDYLTNEEHLEAADAEIDAVIKVLQAA